jgi:hypothetical protein
VAGTAVECSYSGPQGTKNVGICKASVKICAADGNSYGACSAEVTPQAQENCKVIGDENCDGKVCSDPDWGKLFGDGQDQMPSSIAVDSMGNIVVAGSFKGVLTLSPTVTATSSGGNDFFLAQFDPTGIPLWIKSFGDGVDNVFGAAHVAVSKGNDIIVVGTLLGKADFGGGLIPASGGGGGDIFVAKFGQAGTFQWAKVAGDAAYQSAGGVTTDSQSNIIVSGSYQGGFSFGANGPVNANGQDGYVTKFAPNGNCLWSKRFSDTVNKGTDIQGAGDVAVDTADNVIVTGTFITSLTVGALPPLAAFGGGDMFLAKLTPAGGDMWAKSFGTPGYDGLYAVAVDSLDHIVITGNFAGPGSITFGGGNLTVQGQYDGFVASFTGAGVHQWSSRFGGPTDNSGYPDTGSDIATDKNNNIVLTGVIYDTVTFGAPVDAFTSAGGSDVFIAKLDVAGNHIWSKLFGDANDQTAGGIATDPMTNQIVLATGVQGSINFGKGSLPASAVDVGIAKFEP